MLFGASTSNLYPDLTENALSKLLDMGINTVEVFLNTESETDPGYLREMQRRTQEAGGRIVSVHPYLSATEPYLLFSTYERRYRDGMKHYAHIFDSAAKLGADYVVMHGAKEGALPMDDAIERFGKLYDLGQEYGVTLLQENVVHYRAAHPDYILRMRELLGEKAGFVFDFKQCRRAGHTPDELLDAMGNRVKHLHISDATPERDCLLPGKGTTDLAGPLQRLKKSGFNGACMLELYRSNFGEVVELAEGINFLCGLL